MLPIYSILHRMFYAVGSFYGFFVFYFMTEASKFAPTDFYIICVQFTGK